MREREIEEKKKKEKERGKCGRRQNDVEGREEKGEEKKPLKKPAKRYVVQCGETHQPPDVISTLHLSSSPVLRPRDKDLLLYSIIKKKKKGMRE